MSTGQSENFYCGDLLDEKGLILFRLKTGELSLQEAYDKLLYTLACPSEELKESNYGNI